MKNFEIRLYSREHKFLETVEGDTILEVVSQLLIQIAKLEAIIKRENAEVDTVDDIPF